MPCGCFGGSKKKGSPRGSEGPPKPPKLLAEESVKQQHATPAYLNQPESLPLNGNAPNSTKSPLLNSNVNGNSVVAAPTTPQSEPITAVDGNKSSGARSRAELYAKRREFFRPLYDVSLANSNQRFGTPRSFNTLPARGKKGTFLIGDGSGYFTAEGRYVAGNNEQNAPESGGIRYGSSGEQLPVDMNLSDSGTNFMLKEGHYVDSEGRVADRPHRPTSQPSALAGQWEELMDQENAVPQDEFHQKHHQIIQHQHTQSIPPPPPAPKVNPHFVEFQETHHKILHDPESHAHHRNTDSELAQKSVENRLSELDKLHNEVQEHYEKRMKNGPVDVDSLVEKYTEDRWKKMVELWESEGLVVEGGMVVVDDTGNVVERKMKANNDGSHVVDKVTHIVESIGDDGEKITKRIEKQGDTIVKIVETKGEYKFSGETPDTVKHTEEILVESFVQKEPFENFPVTTIVTPPTPQIDISSRVTPLADITTEEIDAVEQDIEEFEQYEAQLNSNDFTNVVEESVNEPIVELVGDENFKNVQHVIERERIVETDDDRSGHDDPSPYRVSPPPTPPPTTSDEAMPPTTCTPPPSPQRGHEQKGSSGLDMTSVCAAVLKDDSDEENVLGKGSATPPPSPPMQVSEQHS